MKSMKNKKQEKKKSIHIYTIYNNGSFVINFIKLFMHHIFSIFSSSSSSSSYYYYIICNSYFVQLFIFFNYCIFSSIFQPFQ